MDEQWIRDRLTELQIRAGQKREDPYAILQDLIAVIIADKENSRHGGTY